MPTHVDEGGDEGHEAANATASGIRHSQLSRTATTISTDDEHLTVLSQHLDAAQRISDDGELLLVDGE